MPNKCTGTYTHTFRLMAVFAALCIVGLATIGTLYAADREEGKSKRPVFKRQSEGAIVATPTFVQPGNFAAPSLNPSALGPSAVNYDQARLLAGHLLRRIGFGGSKKELKAASKNLTGYINQQLNPQQINDDKAEGKLPRTPRDIYDDYDLIRGWYIRMVYSKRQLLEKMTLIWHEHFATSNDKVGVGGFMQDYEFVLRANALGSFRNILIDLTKDQAMLIWLDNNRNNGNAHDDNGNPIPPNENYAREFMQLFSIGTVLLNLDGTPILDPNGVPLPSYTETDVREVARALTGWVVPWPYKRANTTFSTTRHDEGNKDILGVTLVGRIGTDGENEVGDVVDIVLQQRKDTVAAFVSKELIQKLVTETPPPDYVLRVATAFRDSNFDIREAVRAILTDVMFTDPTVIRSQYKEPIEQYIGAVRALKGKSKGDALINWTYAAGQLIYYPPSVFSFYPPGNKGTLLNTAMVFQRDKEADQFVRGYSDTFFKPSKLMNKYNLTTPDLAVDFLSDWLLVAPLQAEVRTEIINYMGGQVTEDKFLGATWMILCSPDYQRN
jgi:uncharacterized protein (DUF1800 family)